MAGSMAVRPDDGGYLGKPVLRLEDGPLLTGRGSFVDDLPVRKTTLHAAILRSPHAHAEILSMDASDALAQPGVAAVITGRDMFELTDPMIIGLKTEMEYRCLAVDRVRFVGEPVAIVCAESRYKAEDALDHIKIEYRPLAAVVDPVEAAEPDAPVIHPKIGSNTVAYRTFRHGDPQGAFASAPHTAELTVRYPRNSITPMECYALVAEYLPETGGYDVISNFQGPFSLHPVMARALRISGSRLRHRSPKNSGGSFGSKLTLFPYIVAMCIASRVAGRPVKWTEDRLEHLSAASSAPNRVTRIEAAFTDDGEVTGLRFEHWDDHGAFLRAPMPAPIFRMHGLTSSAYKIKNFDVAMHIVSTNKCPSGAVRGFGGPQLYYAIERMMQHIAVRLGLNPLEVVCRNLLPSDSFPYQAPAGALLDSGNYHALVEALRGDGRIDDLAERCRRARSEGRVYGIGYAAAVEPSQSNMGYIATLKTREQRAAAGPKDGATSYATVSVDPVGSVSVSSESVPQGQGHATVLAQIVADQLGLRPEDVAVNLELDTQKDAWSIAAGNYSSRFAPAVASAGHLGARRVREKLGRIAAQTLNVPPEDLDFADGRIFARSNPENSVPFYRVAGLAHWSPRSLPDGMEPGLRETVAWNAPQLTPTSETDEINSQLAYGFGIDACGVEIDPDTGQITIDRYISAHDCGTVLNPGLAEGQIRGSFAAAVGAALYEEFAYTPDGTFLSGTFAEYLIPTAQEMPEVEIVYGEPSPSPFTLTGAKGIAEGNTFTTPVCIANAVADALGVSDVQLPLTPARVSEWLHGPEKPLPGRGTEAAAVATRGRRLTGRGERIVPAPHDQVWDGLLDPGMLAQAIPGCRDVEAVGENEYQAAARIGVGPVRGEFEARVRLFDLEPCRALRLAGDVTGPLGSGGGEGHVTLEPVSGGTRVRYDYAITLSGKIAAVGGRMLDGAARSLIGQFFASFDKQFAGPGTRQSVWAVLLRWIRLGKPGVRR